MPPRSKQSVKLDDVADLAKVSPSTVSLYVRHPEKVSPKNGHKIQLAIDELGYVHNKIASQFTAGRSSAMAIIVPSISNITFSTFVQQIEHIVSDAGFQLYIASHDHSMEKEEQQIRSILQWSPAAITLTGAKHSDATIRMLEHSAVPVVQAWQIGEASPFVAQVGIDHLQVGYDAASYLIRSGCHKIAYFTTRFNDDVRAQSRYSGFCQALETAGMDPLLVEIPYSDNIYPAARELLIKTLLKERKLDGIFASNDTIGTALLMEAIARNIPVPEQLSIIGFGDFPGSGYLAPVTLSSININIHSVASQAASMMLRMARDPDYKGEIIDAGFDLIPRQSTRFVL
ncbi:LacI family DNA-binding transcriptional regulator [Aeromonas veronii]|uniref:LacI family DNA-binding transcriptional regulator n=1 Tax=Aeromonas veronii TaxID=654 RepID=UPI001116E7DD|nr:LacI family DNA-binding transcriptional regulator [Aeromonas veronii]TNI02215.1 LacI family transcriptional regulator [Aeromonas veronii]HDO1314000.1 LacI family DNA-binding transcriptional regulator [Aeromonas veronii]